MKERVRLADIADRLNLSVTTVSRALAGKGRVSEATRLRIEKKAKAMGYRPDPVLSRLAAYRSGGALASDRVIAMLTDAQAENHPAGQMRFKAARERAEELGYRTERFSLADYEGRVSRLAHVLKTRSVDALLVDAVRNPGSYNAFPWKDFHAIAMGGGVEMLPLSTITNDLLSGLRIVWQRLAEAGYRRLGLVILSEAAIESRHLALAGGKVAQSIHPSLPEIPFFSLPLNPGKKELAVFQEWLQTHRPDVVIGHDYVAETLHGLGVAVPEQVAFACYALWEDEKSETDLAGLKIDLRRVGELAVEMCHLELERPSLSVRQSRILHLVEPYWRQGASLPLRRLPDR